MCFVIKKGVAPWQQRTVWKVVELRKNAWLRSPYRMHFHWHANKEYVLRKNARTRSWIRAHAGFYVFRTQNDARAYAALFNPVFEMVVIRLEVHPDDFLYQDERGVQATYRRVFLPEERQPDVEFF